MVAEVAQILCKAKFGPNFLSSMSKKTSEHYAKIRFVLIVVLLLNWAVALAKIFYGLWSRSASITADGFHSLSDGISNLMGLIGIAVASQPRDKDHPYGHKKYETLFSLGIGVLLLFVCFNLIKDAVGRFYHPIIPQLDDRAFIVMFVTIIVNLVVMNFEYNHGKILKSDILVSDSIHTKADIFTSFSVIVAIIVMKMGYPIIDPIVTLLISCFIAYSAYEIIKQSSEVLCDTVVIVNVKDIEKIVLSVKGVESCHRIRSRGRSDDIYIDLHVLVNSKMTLEDAHKISHDIEDAIQKAIPGVTEVIAHMEPKEIFPK